MKLRKQVFLLIAAPIICEVVSMTLLFAASQGVENAGRRETQAKRVLTLSHEVFVLLGVRIVSLTQSQFLPAIRPDNRLQLDDILTELQQLTSDNREASGIIARLRKTTDRLLNRMDDLAKAYAPPGKSLNFAQFLESQDYVDSTGLAFNELRAESSDLSKIYEPLSREFQPNAVRARNVLRGTVVLIVILNVIVIGLLMKVVNAQALKRLQALMENIRAFSAGNMGSTRLDGNDELAELDRTFAQVSSERLQLDEVRKSMTAMVSHDLRSPLTSMTLSLDYLVEDEGDDLPDKVRSVLKRMRSDADRLRRLSTTLLDIAKIESGKIDVNLERVKIAEIIEPSLSAIYALIKVAKVEVETEIDSDIILRCDKDRTIQVLVNFLSNAMKFAPAKSTVRINVRRDSSDMVRFEVIDSGPGVPPDQQSRLFSKFTQLEQPQNIKQLGSGLGLYICKTLITAQGGAVGFERAPAGGACFWFTLPEAKAAAL